MKYDLRKQAEEKVREEAKGKTFSTIQEARRWRQARYREVLKKLYIANKL